MTDNSNFYHKPIVIFLFIALLVLSSCASRQQTGSISPATDEVFNILNIDVTASNPSDQGDQAAHGLAEQLQLALVNSIGVPDTEFTRPAKLYVKILPVASLDKPDKKLAGHLLSFGAMRIDIHVRVADIMTDTTLKSAEFNAASTSSDPQIASIVIEEKLVAQIRHFLGLTLMPPMMISKQMDKMIGQSGEATMVTNQAEQDFASLQVQAPTVLIPLVKAREPLSENRPKQKISVDELISKAKKNDVAMNAIALETRRFVEKEMASPDIKTANPVIQSKNEAPSTSIETFSNVADSREEDGFSCVVTVQNNCLTILGK